MINLYDCDYDYDYYYLSIPKFVKCILPVLWRKDITYTHIICTSAITSVPGHEYSHSGLWYDCTTGFTRTDMVSHT